jgi:hypothetical protein
MGIGIVGRPRLYLLKFYVFVIEKLQSMLLAISKFSMFLYSPLPTAALHARLAILKIKNDLQ